MVKFIRKINCFQVLRGKKILTCVSLAFDLHEESRDKREEVSPHSLSEPATPYINVVSTPALDSHILPPPTPVDPNPHLLTPAKQRIDNSASPGQASQVDWPTGVGADLDDVTLGSLRRACEQVVDGKPGRGSVVKRKRKGRRSRKSSRRSTRNSLFVFVDWFYEA